MYVTTFYSFKGGVGRTFALVNVAVDLATSGRKVLLVDFDLEAPGIHTFNDLRPPEPHSGVVEYVTDFIASRSAPDVREYIYELDRVGREGGGIWVMPAGRGGNEYRERLASINWQHLYAELDGYLFFEDLKAQWSETIRPDYVLIDSRTGHTDIEGICTRQLPDAVVILFFPNEQNLAGLKEVVSDINAEAGRSRVRKKPVEVHFVMSNVPDLDDEEGILKRRVAEFRKALNCKSHLMIHNYPSLALLNQQIFTLERPESRLAKEYRRLKDQIVDSNNEDPESAVRLLKRAASPFGRHPPKSIRDLEEQLKTIQSTHGENAEVAFRLGVVRKNQAKLAEAVALFKKAIDGDYCVASALLERATCFIMLGKPDDAVRDAKRSLEVPGLRIHDVLRAIDVIAKHSPGGLEIAAQSPYLALEVDDKLILAKHLSQYESGLATAARSYLEAVAQPSVNRSLAKEAGGPLTLALIGAGHFDEAMTVIGHARPLPMTLPIEDALNYAMVEWAKTGVAPKDMFERVVELDSDQSGTARKRGANYDQCLAIALWVTGAREAAKQRLLTAVAKAGELNEDAREFSCWQYKWTSRGEFLSDCQAIASSMEHEDMIPAFFPPTPRGE
jgi:MinD-like ATPase involved in chromosome partitioning or flagellar assembly